MTFAKIRARAEDRKGGAYALEKLLPPVMPVEELAALGDDRVLAMMCRCINNAGFNWSVIEKKWPQFEEAFYGFDPARLASLAPEEWEAYAKDTRIVRHWPKIKAVMQNVGFVIEVSEEHGSFAKFLADWPAHDQIGLLVYLKKHGSRLGGNTGQYFLRYIGKDSFVMSRDVINAIRDSGVEINEQPTSKRDMQKVQDTFNAWQEESGLPYSTLSRIAAFSIGRNYESDFVEEEQETHF